MYMRYGRKIIATNICGLKWYLRYFHETLQHKNILIMYTQHAIAYLAIPHVLVVLLWTFQSITLFLLFRIYCFCTSWAQKNLFWHWLDGKMQSKRIECISSISNIIDNILLYVLNSVYAGRSKVEKMFYQYA